MLPFENGVRMFEHIIRADILFSFVLAWESDLIPVSLLLTIHIPRHVSGIRDKRELCTRDSFTFYLETLAWRSWTIFPPAGGAAAFPRREILEDFLEGAEWTAWRGSSRIGRERERGERERLKKTTYGARGSGRTRASSIRIGFSYVQSRAILQFLHFAASSTWRIHARLQIYVESKT